jgi:deoxyribodipyrimidine photo-lyase
MRTKEKVTVFWFRRDLRLFDNHALLMALKSGRPVLPIYIFDKNLTDIKDDPKNRSVSYLYQQLNDLEKELNQHESSLWIIHDSPLDGFKTICSTFEVETLFANELYEPYAIRSDHEVEEFLKSEQISWVVCKDQVVFHKNDVMKNDGTPYSVFTPYSKIWKQKLAENGVPSYDSEKYLSNLLKTNPFPFPSLEALGFETTSYPLLPKEIDPQIIINYHNTRDIPSLNGTSRLSVSLRFGTVSVRQLVSRALELNEVWLNELIWREFFMMILYHYPQVVKESFKKKHQHIAWRNNENEFDLWCKGETGYPIVDAGMRELNETGLMHNRVRMIVASFLTKHLLIDWRWGEAYFAEKLLDYELSSNNGNWQWSAGCGCDAAPYFRIFNPEEQTKKFDPQHTYIQQWIKDYQPGYLKPIVEHTFARKRALLTYKKALEDPLNPYL